MRSTRARLPLARLTLITLGALLLTALPAWRPVIPGPSALGSSSPAGVAQAQTGTHTPAPGSAERQAMVDALRREMAKWHQVKMVFKVTYLQVHGGWAWISAQPHSPDGRQNYEDVNALLQKKAGGWQVAELACTEAENPDCLDAPGYFQKLRARFPGAPADIFPKAP